MNNATLLLLMDVETSDDTVKTFAEASAPANTHLSCLILGTAPELATPTLGLPPYGAFSVPDDWTARLQSERQLHVDRQQHVEAILADAGVPASVQSVLTARADLRLHVAHWARVSDVAYVAPSLRETGHFAEAMSGVLFDAPIGLVLNSDAPLSARSAFIAWDSSKAAARAVHAALPMLKTAKEVNIGIFDPLTSQTADGANPGSGLAAWLSHHGCDVTVNQYPSGGREIADCLLDRARETGAEVVVMGAYGHARVRQAVFGGTTRSMINQTTLPLFLAH